MDDWRVFEARLVALDHEVDDLLKEVKRQQLPPVFYQPLMNAQCGAKGALVEALRLSLARSGHAVPDGC